MKLYKFTGKKNKVVKSVTTGNIVFSFDARGVYMTTDEEIATRAMVVYPCEELEIVEPLNEPIEAIEKEIYKCKKCDFETDNKGLLMSHYKDHKKEEK
jgi:hypothetical protein